MSRQKMSEVADTRSYSNSLPIIGEESKYPKTARVTNRNPKNSVDGQGDIKDWVIRVPVSRVWRNINRDFSDGVFFAEVLNHFFPKLVELHNYVHANSLSQKLNNWNTLSKKVLPKIGMKMSTVQIMEIADGKPGRIENILNQVRTKVIIENEKQMAREVNELKSRKSFSEDTCISLNDDPENGIMYKNMKMVPAYVAEDKDQVIQELEITLAQLRKKVRRQETLLFLKEEHLQDLTFELQELRTEAKEKNVSSPKKVKPKK